MSTTPAPAAIPPMKAAESKDADAVVVVACDEERVVVHEEVAEEQTMVGVVAVSDAPGAAAATAVVMGDGVVVSTLELDTPAPTATNVRVRAVVVCSLRACSLSSSRRDVGQIVVPAELVMLRSVTTAAELPVDVKSDALMAAAKECMAADDDTSDAGTLLTPYENWTTATHAVKLVELAGDDVPAGHATHEVPERYWLAVHVGSWEHAVEPARLDEPDAHCAHNVDVPPEE